MIFKKSGEFEMFFGQIKCDNAEPIKWIGTWKTDSSKINILIIARNVFNDKTPNEADNVFEIQFKIQVLTNESLILETQQGKKSDFEPE